MCLVCANSKTEDYAVIGVDLANEENYWKIHSINNGIFPIVSSDTKVLDYYDEWGYEPTLKYIRTMNSSGDIPLMTRIKIQDMVTEIYLTPTPRALVRKFNKGIV